LAPSWHGHALPAVTRAITSVTKADLPLPGAPPRTVSLPRAIRSGQTHSGSAQVLAVPEISCGTGPGFVVRPKAAATSSSTRARCFAMKAATCSGDGTMDGDGRRG